MKNDDSGHSLTNPIHDSAGDDDEYHSDSNLVITGTLGFSSGLELETINEAIDGKREIPNMWSRDYIGLYSQYAAVGLLYGSAGTLLPFCVYHYEADSNVCANARNIMFFAWNIKIFFAIGTDLYRPFGMRRRPWMMMGLAGTAGLLLVLAFAADSMSVSAWLVTLLFMQAFLMLSDVPADGYCVELGQMESKESRGQILATGQRVRFTFCVIAGSIQTFLLNGPTTNSSDCPTSFSQCWGWGLTINQYYGLLFCMVAVLAIPVCFLKELDASNTPQHTFSHFMQEIWMTLKNLTTCYLVIFVLGTQALTNFVFNVNIYLQYYVIKLTNFEAGIDTITTYLALVAAIWTFQTYLINRNWRHTQYGSTIAAALLGLLWILPYYDVGGTMSPWFTIFIDLDQGFAQGLTQILYSMAVIELAVPGLEATTYELIITVGNTALLINGIISTQLLFPLQSVGCDKEQNCPANEVDVTSKAAFRASDGPHRYTVYNLVMTAISICACLVFTQFLPRSKEECHVWKRQGEQAGTSSLRGKVLLAIVIVVSMYGITVAILLLDPDTACYQAVGGIGCGSDDGDDGID